MAKKKQKPGLGSSTMSQHEKDRIHSLGGKASPESFDKNKEKARTAGQKGGSH